VNPGDPPPPARDMQEWHRLHPLSPVVRAGRYLIGLVLIAAPALLTDRRHDRAGTLIVDSGLLGVVLILGLVSWLVTRWRIEGDALRIETGLIRRSSQRIPLSQVQAIDIERTGIARLLGLAELRLRMAGTSTRGGRLASLTAPEAEALRSRLLAIGHGSPAAAPAGYAPGYPAAHPASPERPLFSLPTDRLVASMLLTKTGLAGVGVVVAIVVLSAVSPRAAAAVIAAGTASFVGLFTTIWRRFNSGYRLTVAEAPDGLRMRSGLVQTTAETIPYGRIQAARLIEPLLWRPFGWRRLDVDVAGGRAREENRAESRHSRTLVPVGDRAEADRLLRRVIPDPPAALSPPPPRARWKAPFRYRYLAWGEDGRTVVSTDGRVRRITRFVPLEKVQSIRRVQGPLQRRLGLATIHLDTAGRRSKASLRDRDTAEVEREMRRLPALCRAARHAPIHRAAR
jgi:putative membrane protein